MLILVMQVSFKKGHCTKAWAVFKETYGMAQQHPSVSNRGRLLDPVGHGEEAASGTI